MATLYCQKKKKDGEISYNQESTSLNVQMAAIHYSSRRYPEHTVRFEIFKRRKKKTTPKKDILLYHAGVSPLLTLFPLRIGTLCTVYAYYVQYTV